MGTTGEREMRERLDPQLLRVDPRVKDGFYTDKYFNRAKEILEKDNHHPYVRMQFFQKNDKACLCGIDEAIGILRESLDEDFHKLNVNALYDGDLVDAHETVMTIEGDYSLFAHMETVMLGALARRTRVATNAYNTIVSASRFTTKPIMFFPARFDIYQAQAGDGYAYEIARQASGDSTGGVSTHAQGEWWGADGLGTIPHALIAAYGGDTPVATLKFAEYIDPKVKRVSLVDFDNDCVNTAIDVAWEMWQMYVRCLEDPRYKLHAVRLDTSGTMVDESLQSEMGQFKPTGVNKELVWAVHNELNAPRTHEEFGKYCKDIGIIVSGGFTPDKIKDFEDNNVPVIGYGVGSSMFRGNYDFTADIVGICEDRTWRDCAKVGRKYNANSRLETVK